MLMYISSMCVLKEGGNITQICPKPNQTENLQWVSMSVFPKLLQPCTPSETKLQLHTLLREDTHNPATFGWISESPKSFFPHTVCTCFLFSCLSELRTHSHISTWWQRAPKPWWRDWPVQGTLCTVLYREIFCRDFWINSIFMDPLVGTSMRLSSSDAGKAAGTTEKGYWIWLSISSVASTSTVVQPAHWGGLLCGVCHTRLICTQKVM